ncbi:hypothetical protein AcW1_001637 [Taiwanofungus camphoratus]|nr:hypothetical protein AcW1_001637 [Antrodia cinnamomea]
MLQENVEVLSSLRMMCCSVLCCHVSHCAVFPLVLTTALQVPIRPTPASTLASNAAQFPPLPPSHKPSLDRTFLRQLHALLRIAFPSWRTKEAALLALHSGFLVFRTLLSVAVARLDGRIVRDLVSADGRGFLKGLVLWFALAVPSTCTNTMVRV